MAGSFIKQAQQYAKARPSYTKELFNLIASKTPEHELAWDVGTGNGQAAQTLAETYKNVVATDTSPTQLEFATKLPNIRYQQTLPSMTIEELKEKVAAESTVNLVTVAQAIHWFDLPTFYDQVKWVLKKPHGVIAVWCYTMPEVNEVMDKILKKYCEIFDSIPQKRMVNERYVNLEFPFEPVGGVNGTEPIEFRNEKMMSLEDYFTYLKSWSVYVQAKEEGEDPLSPKVVEDLTNAWNSDGETGPKLVNFPTFLRIGKVGQWEP